MTIKLIDDARIFKNTTNTNQLSLKKLPNIQNRTTDLSDDLGIFIPEIHDKRLYDTIFSEVGGGSPEEVKAVASVFINRANQEGYEKALKGSSAYRKKSREYLKAQSGDFTTQEKLIYGRNKQIIDELLKDKSKRLPYTYMENVNAFGEPDWAKNMQSFKDIGRQRFYIPKIQKKQRFDLSELNPLVIKNAEASEISNKLQLKDDIKILGRSDNNWVWQGIKGTIADITAIPYRALGMRAPVEGAVFSNAPSIQEWLAEPVGYTIETRPEKPIPWKKDWWKHAVWIDEEAAKNIKEVQEKKPVTRGQVLLDAGVNIGALALIGKIGFDEIRNVFQSPQVQSKLTKVVDAGRSVIWKGQKFFGMNPPSSLAPVTEQQIIEAQQKGYIPLKTAVRYSPTLWEKYKQGSEPAAIARYEALEPVAGGKVSTELPAMIQKLQAKGITITGRLPGIRIVSEMAVKDIYGNKVILPKGEEYQEYKLSNNQVLLHDGKNVIVNKNQLENLKGQNIQLGEKQFLKPEEQNVEVIEKGAPQNLSDAELKELKQKYGTLTYSEAYDIYSKEKQTKFSQYQLPGGENYKEILFTIPIKKNYPMSIKEENQLSLQELGKEVYNLSNTERRQLKEIIQNRAGVIYKSPHWDEPNPISHARINDRTTPDGKKILFIEEIQSDWARKIRGQGNIKPLTTQEVNKLADLRTEQSMNGKFGHYFTPEMQSELNQLEQRYNIGIGTPQHPLLKNWQEFTLKRLVDYAIKNGYDGISWTTGEQQAERYDLSKHLQSIDYFKRKNGTYSVTAIEKDGNEEIIKDGAQESELAGLVGKDTAQKIINDEGKLIKPNGLFKRLSDVDLKIGGEWAKNLYDKQIPNILKDLTKGRLGESELLVPRKTNKEMIQRLSQPSLLFTPQVKSQVLGEQPLAGGRIKRPLEYQDKNQEIIIHSEWKKGNSYRYLLEGTGDIFRELTKQNPDFSYISEKIRRLENFFSDMERQKQFFPKTGIHPDDSIQIARQFNEDKFKQLIDLWNKQPTNSDIQKVAKELNLDMLQEKYSNAKSKIKIIKDHFVKEPTKISDIISGKVPPTRPPAAVSGAPTPEEEPIYNVKNLNISQEKKDKIIKIAEQIKPELEKFKGPLTHNEVLEAAKASQILRKAQSREKTMEIEAAILRTRQQLAELSKQEKITPEFIDTLKLIVNQGTALGRQLESLKILGDPQLADVKMQIIKDLLRLGMQTEDILKESEKVDWNNAEQVTKFYRQFVKPSLSDILNEYAYINILSSPRTHIVNAFSNMIQLSFLDPATKLASGAVDAIWSNLNPKYERNHYFVEIPTFYKGAFNSVPKAVSNFLSVMQGKLLVERPDVRHMSTASKFINYATLGIGKYVPRALEASDILFRTMIQEGEVEALSARATKQGKELNENELVKIQNEAARLAQYYVFRQKPGEERQGGVLKGIDEITKAVYGFRRVWGVKWFIRFVQTPMEIFKQGIEYSPTGFGTVAGAKDKVEQIGKAIIGSVIFLGASALALQGRTTWKAPRDKEERKIFFSTGRKPFSIKIGNKWISYSKIGPIAYPIAMASAIHWYMNENPRSVTDTQLEKMRSSLYGIMEFLGDQSYVSALNDILESFKGDETGKQAQLRTLTNVPRQLIPLVALQGWTAKLIDPVFRKTEPKTDIETIKQDLMKGIPFLSKKLPAYLDEKGNIQVEKYPFLNAISPLGISKGDIEIEKQYQKAQQIIGVRTFESEEKKKLRETAEQTFKQLEELPSREANQRALEIKKKNPQVFDYMKRIAEDKKLGLTYSERLVKNLGIEDGSRAKYIYSELMQLGSNKERNSYVRDLVRKKIITRKVLLQLQFLIKKK